MEFELKERYTQSAFIGWQINTGFGSYDKGFDKYLQGMGLKGDQEEIIKKKPKNALERAEQIKNADMRMRNNV